MPELNDTAILDLVAATLNELGPPRFHQIAQNLTDYEVMGKWLKKDKVMADDGKGIQRTLMNKLSGAARHVGLYQTYNVNVADVLVQLEVPWRHATTNWAFERREMLMNSGESLVANVIEARRVDAMIDLVEELEDKAFDLLDASDNVSPYGLPYWIVKNSSAGFNGGAASGFTTVGGINPSTANNWKNYTGTYAAVSKADLIKTMRTASRKTKFKTPISHKDLLGSERRRIYVNETTISSMEDLGEAQNENLGRDLARMDNTMVFHNTPIVYVAKLDEDTTNPVYLTDHATFYPVVLKGDYLYEHKPEKAPHQPNVFEVHVDLTYNYICIDRRRNTVLYYSAS